MSALTERMTRSVAVPAAWRAASIEAFAGMKAFAKTLTRRKAIYDLSRLDDRMLADMGVTRGDLHEASRWSLWGADDRLTKLAEERRLARSLG